MAPVAAHDLGSEHDANLIAAAQAASSWARARRATWTDAPLEVAATESPIAAPEADIDWTPPPAVSPAPVVFAPSRSQPSAAARAVASMRSFGPQLVRWLALGAAAAIVGTVAFAGVRYLWNTVPTLPTLTNRPAVAEPTDVVAPPAARRKATGGLRVGSTPAGATVVVDGKARGVTPLTLTNLVPGRHEVSLESDAGSVHRSVRIAANQTAELDERIFSGWLIVYAPFEVVIVEGARVLQPDAHNEIMLPPGIHELRMMNRGLAYETTQRVEVKPGERTTVRLTPPASTLTVTASDAAEVWVDGARVGATPLNAAPVPLGTHDLVVRREAGGERRFTVTIGAKPFTLAVDFR